MELTRKQEEGLRIAVERYKNKEAYTCISGFAGAGKTTLVKFIISALGIEADKVAYVSFTGKAAEVLRHKGNPNAMTAHKLLYYTSKLPTGGYVTKPKTARDIPYKVIVVDEVSMLPKEMWDLLISYHRYVIACGDPGQLPPINKDSDNHILDHPHVFLDEIMRQAQDSEIIRLSMDIREERPIEYVHGKEIQVIKKNAVIPGMYTWADQIIVATNKKRVEINDAMRAMNGFSGDPQPGDKMISLANHWNKSDFKGQAALTNGTIGYIKECYKDEIHYPMYNFPNKVPVIQAQFISESNEDFGYLTMDYKFITSNTKFLTPQQEYRLMKNKNLAGSEPLEFNYGYAITCHRAQGSQWDKILIFEEWFPTDKEEHKRWLYTAVTRAAEKLVLVR